MAVKEKGRGESTRSFADSDELFEAIFRRELEALKKDKAKNAERSRKAKTSHVRKERPFFHVTAEELRKPASRGKKEPPQVRAEKTVSEKKPPKASNRAKLALLVLLAIILGAVLLNYQGVGDIDFFKTIWVPSNKELIQQPVPPKLASKTDEKDRQIETSKASHQEPTIIASKPTEEGPVQKPSTLRKEEHDIVVPEAAESEIESEEESSRAQPSAVAQEAHSHSRDTPGKWAPLPHKSPISYPYSIYLGSYKTFDRVKKAISTYQEKGLSPYWVRVDLRAKGVWFRLFAGYFRNREDAEVLIRKNKLREAESKYTRYANLVGVYESEEELEIKRHTLIALGYDPYVIRAANGESLLYSGAFYQKGRAEKEHRDLASKGIQSQLVER